ncbi:hypothetical protein TeGR_g14944, partial [Tetraparma gracilis]
AKIVKTFPLTAVTLCSETGPVAPPPQHASSKPPPVPAPGPRSKRPRPSPSPPPPARASPAAGKAGRKRGRAAAAPKPPPSPLLTYTLRNLHGESAAHNGAKCVLLAKVKGGLGGKFRVRVALPGGGEGATLEVKKIQLHEDFSAVEPKGGAEPAPYLQSGGEEEKDSASDKENKEVLRFKQLSKSQQRELETLRGETAEKDGTIAEMGRALAEKDEEIAELGRAAKHTKADLKVLREAGRAAKQEKADEKALREENRLLRERLKKVVAIADGV